MRDWTVVRCGGVLVVLSLAVGACGSSSKTATPQTTTTTATTTSTTVPPTTSTLAVGETSDLAAFAKRLPGAYTYVDAPTALVNQMLVAIRKDPQTADAVAGTSAHSVVRTSDQQSIAIVVLFDIKAEYASLPGFDEAALVAIGGGGTRLKLGGAMWTKASDPTGTMYAAAFGHVLVLVLGQNQTTTEAFLTAIQPT